MSKNFNFLVKIFEFFGNPFRRRKKITELEKVLLEEEFKAEKTISIIRVAFYGIGLLASLIYLNISSKMNFLHDSLPYLICFIISLIILGKMLVFNLKKEFIEKYFFRFLKYITITSDVAMISFLTYMVYTSETYTIMWSLGDITSFSYIFIIFSSLLIFVDIFRFSRFSSIFLGGVLIISYFILHLLIFDNNPVHFFIKNGKTQYINIEHIFLITLLAFLSAFISFRISKVIHKSINLSNLERFLPSIVAREIISKGTDISLEGTRENVTILFSDIRNFTSMSENADPKEVINFLNSYFNKMIDIIFKYKGTLDKIIGDGIMAIYGAPMYSEEATQNAVRTAVEMQKCLDEFNLFRKKNNLEEIEIGIGIHTGKVIMGNVGSNRRMDFTAIGDTVNTASRLQNLTKSFDAKIIISEITKNQINGDFNLLCLGQVLLKGKQKKVEIFKVDI